MNLMYIKSTIVVSQNDNKYLAISTCINKYIFIILSITNKIYIYIYIYKSMIKIKLKKKIQSQPKYKCTTPPTATQVLLDHKIHPQKNKIDPICI